MQVALILLRKYWPLVLAGVVLAVLWQWHTAAVSRADKAGYARAMSEAAAAWAADVKRTDKIRQETDRAYQDQITSLESRVSQLRLAGTPIRMCAPAVEVRLPAPGRVPDDPAPEQGQADGAGPDLRPRLVEYGASCQKLQEQVIGLQAFINGVGTQ